MGGLFVTLLVGAGGTARAAGGMTLSVHITSQGEGGDVCQYMVGFDATIVNNTGVPVIVQSVDYGAYDTSNANDGGLHPGTVLLPGTNEFPGNWHGGGFDSPVCNSHPPPPLVLTVGTDHGTLVWDQSAQPPTASPTPSPTPSATATPAGCAEVASMCAMTLSVHITGQGQASDVCQYYVNFDALIVNNTAVSVVVLSVDYGPYNRSNVNDGGLHAGTVLHPGNNEFPGNSHGGGFDGPPCNENPPPGLWLTVQTNLGKLTWIEDAQPVPSSGPIGGFGVALLTGVGLVASQARRRRRRRAASI
jgi:hypothetical protein